MFKKNFIKLCAERNESPTAVCTNIGLNKSAFSYWDEHTVPRATTLQKVADYFGVPVSYFTEEHTTDVGTVHDNHGFIGNNHATVNINNNLPESNLGEIEKELLAVCQKLDTKRKAALLVKAYELLEQ